MGLNGYAPVTLSNLQTTCIALALPLPNTGLNLPAVPPSSIGSYNFNLGLDEITTSRLGNLNECKSSICSNRIRTWAPVPPPPVILISGAIV